MTHPPRPCILLVDDRPENLLAMERILGDLDVDITSVGSGQQALAAMLRTSFAVVLLDVQMPGMSGFEAAELMRDYEGTRTTPIIFVTAISKEEKHVFRGYEAGAVDYIFKPVEPVILRSKVQIFLELARQRADLAATVAELEQANADLDRFAHAVRGLLAERGSVWSPDDNAPLIHPGEMVKRLHRLLEEHAHSAVDAETSGAELPAGHVPIQFRGVQYLLPGRRAPLVQTVVSATEDLIDMSEQIEHTHLWLREEITERRRAEAASRSASQAKSRFLANISHELRTPLNGIIGLSEIARLDAQRGTAGPSLVEQLELIHESGLFLSQLVDRLMARSLIEVDQMSVDAGIVDVCQLLQNVSSSLQPIAAKQGNQLSFECADDVGELETDGVKLREILQNLVANACKFTDGGDIRLTAIRASVDGEEKAIFQVRDTGIGIDPSHHQSIFDDFKQVDESSTRRYGGVGLGLSLCRHYCSLMGGTIGVESQPGEGAVFTVTLPASR